MIGLLGIILLSTCQGLTEGATWNFIFKTKTRLVKDGFYYHTYRSLEMLGLWGIVYSSQDCGLLDAIDYGLIYFVIYRSAFVFERYQNYKEIGRTEPYKFSIFGKTFCIPYPNWIIIVLLGIMSLAYQIWKLI
jgi:hypothetical protein